MLCMGDCMFFLFSPIYVLFMERETCVLEGDALCNAFWDFFNLHWLKAVACIV